MPLERPYEYVIVIILAHFEIDHLHLLAAAYLQQNVAHAALPGTALTARTCAGGVRTPSTRKRTMSLLVTAATSPHVRRCRECGPRRLGQFQREAVGPERVDAQPHEPIRKVPE
jgi:hypothetical protein